MQSACRDRLRRLGFFLAPWPWLNEEWRERLTEKLREVVR